MRVWAELYDASGSKLGTGPITAIKSASVTDQLDGAGSFKLDLALDERVITALAVDTEVRIFVQDDEGKPAQEWGRGVIRDHELGDEENGTSIAVSGPDLLDELTEVTVGLGRTFQNVTVPTIINTLLGEAGWTSDIETALTGALQTARFDGAHVLRAISRVVEEGGYHFRRGTAASVMDVGVFGERVTTASGQRVVAIKPPSEITPELLTNDTVVFIDRIRRKTSSSDTVNWCLPIGAGEGGAALTLRDTTYAIFNEDGSVWRAGPVTRYKIYRRVNANGIAEFYIDARESSIDRRRQATVAFKEIGAVANSTAAKQLAANMLAQAAMTYLDRQKVALVTYSLSLKHVKATIRPGDKLQVRYVGRVEIDDETRSSTPRLTYIDVDEPFWVMKVTRKISGDQISYDLDVATVDRYAMDSSRIMVSMMEAVQARGLSVQTINYYFENSYTDSISNADGKTAKFQLTVNDYVTDVIRIGLRVRTTPLWAGITPHYGGTPYTTWQLSYGYNHPSDITITIDGIDQTSALGGPWASAVNTPIDIELDITSYIVNAAGGLYQQHSIVFGCGSRYGEIGVSPFTGYDDFWASSGIVEASFKVIGSLRAIVPVD